MAKEKETVASKATRAKKAVEVQEYELVDRYKDYTHVMLSNGKLIDVHEGKITVKDVELAKGLIK